MRLLEKVYQINNSGLGDVRIFSDRIFCYKRVRLRLPRPPTAEEVRTGYFRKALETAVLISPSACSKYAFFLT